MSELILDERVKKAIQAEWNYQLVKHQGKDKNLEGLMLAMEHCLNKAKVAYLEHKTDDRVSCFGELVQVVATGLVALTNHLRDEDIAGLKDKLANALSGVDTTAGSAVDQAGAKPTTNPSPFQVLAIGKESYITYMLHPASCTMLRVLGGPYSTSALAHILNKYYAITPADMSLFRGANSKLFRGSVAVILSNDEDSPQIFVGNNVKDLTGVSIIVLCDDKGNTYQDLAKNKATGGRDSIDKTAIRIATVIQLYLESLEQPNAEPLLKSPWVH